MLADRSESVDDALKKIELGIQGGTAEGSLGIGRVGIRSHTVALPWPVTEPPDRAAMDPL